MELDGPIHTHELVRMDHTEAPPQRAASAALPPADQGWQAWSLLAGCVVVNICIWGFAFSFGVLQDYYTTHEPFSSAPTGIAGIGTTTTGLMYLLMPIYFLLLQRWPFLKTYSCWMSFVFLAAGLIGASFAQTVPQLIATQGVLFALGGNMIVVPTITWLDEWFIRRKGLAMGIMWAGDGIGAVIIPLILQSLLARSNFRITLRIMAAGMIVLLGAFMPFLKPRVPVARTVSIKPISLVFLRNTTFWVFQIFNIIQALGYFLPINYLPIFAEYLGYPAQLGALTLVISGMASVLGCIFVGFLCDRLHVSTILAGLSLGAAIAILIVWGTASSIASLLVFAAMYGATASAYSTAWTGMTKLLQSQDQRVDASIALSFLCAGRGIGSIMSGPLSENLIKSAGSLEHSAAALAYGSKYGPLIIFSGCTAVVGGFSFIFSQMNFL